MAVLMKGVPAGFEVGNEASWDAKYKRQDAALADLKAKSNALRGNEVVGAVLSFGVADGHAYYLVVKESPLSVMHIPYLDNYMVSPILLRGLRKADVLAMRKQAAAWDAIFAKHKGKAA